MKVISFFNNEARLIAKAAKNDRSAQQRLYEMFSGKMLSVCRMYIKDVQHAEDVMLTAFFKVFTGLNSYRSEGSFEGWVRRIMIRECISFLRKAKKIEFQENEIEDYNALSEEISSDFQVEYIQNLIDNLPEGYRVVFVMYAIEGYKHQEIAAILNITTGTSKSQLFKARKMLQKELLNNNTAGNGTTYN